MNSSTISGVLSDESSEIMTSEIIKSFGIAATSDLRKLHILSSSLNVGMPIVTLSKY